MEDECPQKKNPSFSGYLYIPEFAIIVDSSIVNDQGRNHIDIHGLGLESNSPQPHH